MEERITRLGEGLETNGKISTDAMQRVIDALREYKQMGLAAGVEEFRVFATSATRDAMNRNEFLALISRLGFRCRVLSGDEEAFLSYIGVMSDEQEYGPFLVCDIGGGSTEFILGNKTSLLQKKSIDIGSRRLHARFLHSDPVKEEEVSAMRVFLRRILQQELAAMSGQMAKSIAVGGTATTLAMMDSSIDVRDADKAHKHVLVRERLSSIIADLASKTIAERKSIRGLHPGRADVILAGALIVESIMQYFDLPFIAISIRDLLFGALLKWD